MQNKRNMAIQWLLLTGILVLMNVLGQQYFFRLDFTEDRRYTLHESTLETLETLPRPITVRAFFSDNLPPHLMRVRQDFRDLLVEYHERSNGRVVFDFEAPMKNEETELYIQHRGIEPRVLDVRERDEIRQRRIYMGAIIESGEHSATIPFLTPDMGIEYSLNRQIKKILAGGPLSVGIINEWGAAGPNRLEEVSEAMAGFYTLEEVNPLNSSAWDALDALMLVQPRDTIPASFSRALNNYIRQGGRLFMAYAPLSPDMEALSLMPQQTGIEHWLENVGIEVRQEAVIDARCGSITVPDVGRRERQLSFPYFPVITTFAEHPATEGLASVFMPWTSWIHAEPRHEGLDASYLAFTSDRSNAYAFPMNIDAEYDWTRADFPRSNIPVATSLQGSVDGGPETRIHYTANGLFLQSGQGAGQSPDNVNYVLNALDWLTNHEALTTLRNMKIRERPLRDLPGNQVIRVKYANLLIPVAMALFIGVLRFAWQKRKRRKWEKGF